MRPNILESAGKTCSKFIILVSMLVAQSALADATTPVAVPRASITADELGVIIADGDPLSEAIGAYYQTARGIPAANIVRVQLPSTSQDGISVADFNAVKAIVNQALPANVQATLLTWTHPFKVDGSCSMSITSAFAFGVYNTSYCQYGTLTTSSPYYDSSSTHPWQDFGIRPSMMLGAYTLDAAKVLIDRGVQADGSYPVGDGYLVRTTDVQRSVRYADFYGLSQYWNFSGGLTLNYLDNANGSGADYIQNKNDVLFYFTGLQSVPNLDSNHFLPGAIGDHLTSFGGILPPSPGQMPSTRWLEAGATGSYGTVEEPFNYQEKFPRASVVIDQYFRGATLIEACWKSVRSPGEGLFLGEPLARPFSDQLSSTIENGQYVIKTRNLVAKDGMNYYIQSRNTANDDWAPLAGLWVDKPGPKELHSPMPANLNADVKLVGPCPPVAVNLASSWNEHAQGGRAQRVYFQLKLSNQAKVQSDCNQSITLTTPVLPDGLTASYQPTLSTFSIKPGDNAIAVLAVNIPSTIAQTSNAVYNIPIIGVTDNGSGRTYNSNLGLKIDLAAANTTDPSLAPAIRIKRPTTGWYWTNYPKGRESGYNLSVDADIKPNSGISYVIYDLQAIQLYNNEDPAPYYGSVSTKPTYSQPGVFATGTLILPKISPGIYHLTASGYDQNNVFVEKVETDMYTDIQINRIRIADPSSFVFVNIVGTSDNDLIYAYNRGGATITGGGGSNIFIFDRLTSGSAGNTIIIDFNPNADIVDLTILLKFMRDANGVNVANAFQTGLVKLVDTAQGVEIQVAPYGLNATIGPNGAFMTAVRLNNISGSAIKVEGNLKIQP